MLKFKDILSMGYPSNDLSFLINELYESERRMCVNNIDIISQYIKIGYSIVICSIARWATIFLSSIEGI